jgi:hypothetical protein
MSLLFSKEDIIKTINIYQNYINDFVNLSNEDVEYILSEVNK